MTIALVTLVVFAAAWSAAYLLYIRPWLRQYAATAGLLARIRAAEGNLAHKVALWFEGKKTLVLAFAVSALGAAKSALDSTVTGLATIQPTDLESLKDRGVWAAFFSDGVVLKIISALALAAGLLAIRGHLTAAQIMPEAPDREA